ncbi:hypothetical protein GLPA100918_10995 [Glaesserella parasuis]
MLSTLKPILFNVSAKSLALTNFALSASVFGAVTLPILSPLSATLNVVLLTDIVTLPSVPLAMVTVELSAKLMPPLFGLFSISLTAFVPLTFTKLYNCLPVVASVLSLDTLPSAKPVTLALFTFSSFLSLAKVIFVPVFSSPFAIDLMLVNASFMPTTISVPLDSTAIFSPLCSPVAISPDLIVNVSPNCLVMVLVPSVSSPLNLSPSLTLFLVSSNAANTVFASLAVTSVPLVSLSLVNSGVLKAVVLLVSNPTPILSAKSFSCLPVTASFEVSVISPAVKPVNLASLSVTFLSLSAVDKVIFVPVPSVLSVIDVTPLSSEFNVCFTTPLSATEAVILSVLVKFKPVLNATSCVPVLLAL